MRHAHGSESSIQHPTASPDRRLENFGGGSVTKVVGAGSSDPQLLCSRSCHATWRGDGGDGISAPPGWVRVDVGADVKTWGGDSL